MLHQRRGLPTTDLTKGKLNQVKNNKSYYDEVSDGGGGGGGDNHDDHDEEEKRRTEMYEKSCGLAQFFVNPWLFLWLRCQKLKTICSFLCFKIVLPPLLTLRLKLRLKRCLLVLWGNRRYTRYSRILFLLLGFIIIFWMTSSAPTVSSTTKTSSSSSSSLLSNFLTSRSEIKKYNAENVHHVPIIINAFKKEEQFTKPNHIQIDINNNNKEPDYGGLNLSFPKERTINIAHEISFVNDNDNHIYKYFEFPSTTKCEDVSWKNIYNPNCNFFHELNLAFNNDNGGGSIEYINSGFYRDVFSSTHERTYQKKDNTIDTIVDKMAIKSLQLSYNITRQTMLEIDTEALVMERLSSPRIMKIYGHCSTSVGTEFVEKEIEDIIVPRGGYLNSENKNSNTYNNNGNDNGNNSMENEDKNENLLISQNKLNATEKLNIALEMALSIADLHGFKDGVIVHDDIQLRQWLRASDGRLILGDFNRAIIMRWNDVDKQYCKFRSGTVFGDVSKLILYIYIYICIYILRMK
jgi:hypothetical protein